MADCRDYSSALKRALKSKNVNIERIKLLIQKSKKLYCKVLNDAVKSKKCNLEVIKLLLDKGARINPLILYHALTSKACTFEIIKLLLERGAKLYCCILLDAARLERWDFELIKLLINKGADFTIRILSHAIASKKCDSQTFKLLLESGAPITSDSLWRLIQSEKCLELVKLHLEHVGKPYLQKKDLIRKTLYSKRCDKIDIVQLLLKYGLKFDNDDLIVLIEKCGGHIKFLKYVLENGMIIDKNTFKNITIDSSNVYASKILLQYYFIQNSETSLSQMNKILSHDNFFKFADKSLYKEISDFFSLLLKEFIKMTKDKIDYDLTLFSYVSNKYSSTCVEQKTTYSYVNEILSRLSSKQYVYSCDVLCSTLSKYDVTKTLFGLDIFVKKDENVYGDKVSLNIDSLIYLVSYLSRDDIINLILAYSHKDENKSIIKNLKRRCILVEDQDESSLCVKKHKHY